MAVTIVLKQLLTSPWWICGFMSILFSSTNGITHTMMTSAMITMTIYTTAVKIQTY